MNNILLGLQHFALGTVAFLSTINPGGIANHKPQVTPTPKPVINKNIVSRSGQYSYSGYTLKYTVNVPKDGGEVTGSLDGVCKGPITGKFEGGEGGSVEGSAKASCGISFITYDLEAKYNGKIYLKEGKIDLDWEGKIPYTKNQGSFTINFEPAN